MTIDSGPSPVDAQAKAESRGNRKMSILLKIQRFMGQMIPTTPKL
jgi:hypothetical protein